MIPISSFIIRIGLSILIGVLTINCDGSSKKKVQIQPVTFGNIIFPVPIFDKGLDRLIDESRERYKAEEVVVDRPVKYLSDKDYNYWLKIEFLNPELEGKTFQVFGMEVATEIYSHLNNRAKFSAVEVIARYKKGYIVTYSKKQSSFFFRDSLQVR